MKIKLAETITLGKVYECHNPNCALGSRKNPGRFTGGITEAALETLYGTTTEEERNDEGIGFGEGFCVNCGQQGEPALDEDGNHQVHESLVGNDPYQEVHNAIQTQVQEGKLEPEFAQEVLENHILTESTTNNSE